MEGWISHSFKAMVVVVIVLNCKTSSDAREFQNLRNSSSDKQQPWNVVLTEDSRIIIQSTL